MQPNFVAVRNLNQVMNAEGVVMVTSWLDPSRIVGEGNRVGTAGYGN